MVLKKGGVFLVVLAILITISLKYTYSADTGGCYIYPQAGEDIYCLQGVLESEAKSDCDEFEDCSMEEHFVPGSDCSEFSECTDVICSADCQTHAQGICVQLSGKEVLPEEYQLKCAPGCCKIEKAKFCMFGLNEFQCYDNAEKKLGSPTPADTIFDNFEMNADKCNKLYCLVDVKKSALYGYVKDVEDKPLAGVSVVLEGTGIEPQTTDNSGKYIFSSLNPGGYALKATLKDYTTGTVSLYLQSGAEMQKNITLLKAEGTAAIKGVVKDKQGYAVKEATISWTGPASGQVVADKIGAYSIGNLLPGKYAFTASKVGFEAQKKEKELEVGEAQLDFELSSIVFEGVKGTVYVDDVVPNKKPDPDEARYGAKIYVDGQFKGFSKYSDGSYEVAVSVGKHKISATYQNYNYGPEEFTLEPGKSLILPLLLSKYIGECTFPNPPKDIAGFTTNHVKGKKQVELKWSKPCPEVLNYQIKKLSEGKEIGTFTASSAHTSFIDTEVKWGATYKYEIIAFYDAGRISKHPALASITLGTELCEDRYTEKKGQDRFCVMMDEKDGKADESMRKKIFTCDAQNQLVVSEDCSSRGNFYFCANIGEHEADCRDSGMCGVKAQLADPFGLYYSRDGCYGKDNENFCYYDFTSSIVDQCNSCNAINSCFDYKSKDACEVDNCLGSKCQWINSAGTGIINYGLLYPELSLPKFVTPETGAGYCVEADYDKDDQCSLCGPEGNLFENNFCTAEVCSALGKCFSNSNQFDKKALTYCAACGSEPNKEANCYTYSFESECVGGQNLEKNDRQEITLSHDRCSWERCIWKGLPGGAGSCVKDGDGDGKDDCAEAVNAESCRIDNAAPTTTLISSGMNVISLAYPNVTFKAVDKIIPAALSAAQLGSKGNSGSPLGKLGYCLISANPKSPGICTDFTEVSYPGKLKDETVVVNLLGSDYLQQNVPGETYLLRYYSKDKYSNQENVQTAFVYIDNVPPQFDINEEYKTAGEITKLSVYLQGVNEPMECSFSLQQILPEGSTQSKLVKRETEKKEAVFEDLKGVTFNLTVSCEDNNGNKNAKSKMYLFDLEERIDIVSPKLHGAVASTDVVFEAKTAVGAICSLHKSATNEKVADFVSDEEGKSHKTLKVPRFVEGEYAGAYKIVCKELLTDEIYEDYFHFIIDFTPPDTNIILNEKKRTILPRGFGWEEYFIESVSIDFECLAKSSNQEKESVEKGFGCKDTFYCLGEGCELINDQKYKKYSGSVSLNKTSLICYYSTDEANNKVYQPTCGTISVVGYGITLEKPELYYFKGEQWGVSYEPIFTWQFFTKVPTQQCKFDFASGFDYQATPQHKIKEPSPEGKFIFEEFPTSVFSEYSKKGEIKAVYVKCENLEREVGPEQKIYLEYDPSAPEITEAFAEPDKIYEGVKTSLIVSTDDKTVCKYSDNSEGKGSTEYDLMEFNFPSEKDRTLDVTHQTEYFISFLGAKKDYRFNVRCKNGAGNFSNLGTISFIVDYSVKGNILGVYPAGYIAAKDVTLTVTTNKKALCEYKFEKGKSESKYNNQSKINQSNVENNSKAVYLPLKEVSTNVYSASLGILEERKYLIPIRCQIGEHKVEAQADFVIDVSPPKISEVNDGNYTCGSKSMDVMVSADESNFSGFYYEVYDLGETAESSNGFTDSYDNDNYGYSSYSGKKNISSFAQGSSSRSTIGKLVFNNTVNGILPIKVPVQDLSVGHKYYVKVKAADAAGNWGEAKESEGFIVVAENYSVCEEDKGVPEIIFENEETCTATLVNVNCKDTVGCNEFKYGTSATSGMCNPTASYNGQKVMFDKSGWLCYYVKDSAGNNRSSSEEIIFTDEDGDGIADSCDQCEGTSAGKVVDEKGCSDKQTPGSEDIDKDGLPDIWEKMNNKLDCELDYLMADSDENSLSDNLEDYDRDGLANYEEYMQASDPCVADVKVARENYCGDGKCDNEETCSTCSADCGLCEGAGSQPDILAWSLLIIGLLMFIGSAGYLIYLYHYSSAYKSAAGRAYTGVTGREVSTISVQKGETKPGAAKQSIAASWKEKLSELRKSREEKLKERQRKGIFSAFGREGKESSVSTEIPHISGILNKINERGAGEKEPHLPTLQKLAEKYSEHKDEIKPVLRKEEKGIFSKLENIAKQTKEKEIEDVVGKKDAKDIFAKLREVAKKRKV